MQSPWGDGNSPPVFICLAVWWKFEKCSPREGTETLISIQCTYPVNFIWEMQSPWGDGNTLREHIAKLFKSIWEMQSPWGDGNYSSSFSIINITNHLRNAVPVRGRKQGICFSVSSESLFEKCSPREGTETFLTTNDTFWHLPFEKCSPREGTETFWLTYFSTGLILIWEMQSPWGDGNLM